MKQLSILFFTLAFCSISYKVFTNANGPTDGVAGNPPLNETCAVPTCHSGSPLNSGGGTASTVCVDSIGNPVTSYLANNTYTITLSITEGVKTRYGFESIVMKGTANKAAPLGTIIVTDAKTRLYPGKPQYILHKGTGIDFTGTVGSWTFNWKAPNANYGTATIYTAFNATNKDGTSNGDEIYTSKLGLTGVGPQVGIDLKNDNSIASIYPNPAGSKISFDLSSPADIKIFNAQGREIKEIPSARYTVSIDINDLPNGVYFAVVTNSESIGTYRFIKY